MKTEFLLHPENNQRKAYKATSIDHAYHTILNTALWAKQPISLEKDSIAWCAESLRVRGFTIEHEAELSCADLNLITLHCIYASRERFVALERNLRLKTIVSKVFEKLRQSKDVKVPDMGRYRHDCFDFDWKRSNARIILQYQGKPIWSCNSEKHDPNIIEVLMAFASKMNEKAPTFVYLQGDTWVPMDEAYLSLVLLDL